MRLLKNNPLGVGGKELVEEFCGHGEVAVSGAGGELDVKGRLG
jgi:hypothetical protein